MIRASSLSDAGPTPSYLRDGVPIPSRNATPAVPADASAILARVSPRPIVRYLAANPDSYLGDIRGAVDAPVSSLARDLRLLESIGVVTTDVAQPLGARRGRAPRYRLDADRVNEILQDLREQLLG